MKKLFFPFSGKYIYLREYWWHRLFSVVYWVALIFILGWVYFLNQTPETNSYIFCIQVNLETHVRPLGLGCEALEPQTWTNIGFAIIGVLFASYILQFVYFKIFLYILGKKPMSR